jgi:2-polyprenyl-3-methyl-5-hydroxy-6-metoxy-1,4-benzoquinol methylase
MSEFFQQDYKQLIDSPNGSPAWWHSMPLPDGNRINGQSEDKDLQFKVWKATRISTDDGLAGKKVLDIGANDGFYSLAAKIAGAQEVTSIDKDWGTWPKNITFASEAWETALSLVTEDFMEHTTDSKYDVIFFFGVLYHLENVFSCMRKLRDLLTSTGVIYLETQISKINSELPVFEYASDKFPTIARQCKQNLDLVGISNYLFPNDAAVYNLCDSYDFDCKDIGTGSDYVASMPTRQIYRITKR